MENKKYRFGIIVRKGRRNIGVCSCGQHTLGGNNHKNRFQCESCGNDFFVWASKSSGRFVIPYLEAERKDNRGFKVKRTNLSVIYEDGLVRGVKENLTRTIEYDIADKVLKVWRLDELEYDFDTHKYAPHKLTDVNKMFFTQLDESMFLDFISNEVTRDIYCTVVQLLSNGNWNQKRNIIRGLAKLMDSYSYLQILANAGIPNVSRFHQSKYDNRPDSLLDETKTKPHEILKLPKFMMPYLREDISIDRYILQQLQGQLKHIDNNKFREIMAIVKDESTMRHLANSIDTIMTLHIDYEYSNLKNLILYLFRVVRLTQGIETPSNASTLLRDYVRMSQALGLEWEKYPKSLKKVHDVVQLNYKVVTAGKEKQEEFKQSVLRKSYQKLAYIHKKHDYAVILPKTSQDLINEGNELSHCVASYVNDVTNDKCKIVFLRNKENLDTPLATIEVRGMNIRQARGYGNRQIPPEQMEFIKIWAEENNLVEAYY